MVILKSHFFIFYCVFTISIQFNLKPVSTQQSESTSTKNGTINLDNKTARSSSDEGGHIIRGNINQTITWGDKEVTTNRKIINGRRRGNNRLGIKSSNTLTDNTTSSPNNVTCLTCIGGRRPIDRTDFNVTNNTNKIVTEDIKGVKTHSSYPNIGSEGSTKENLRHKTIKIIYDQLITNTSTEYDKLSKFNGTSHLDGSDNGNIFPHNIEQTITESTIKLPLPNTIHSSHPNSESKDSTKKDVRHNTTKFTYDKPITNTSIRHDKVSKDNNASRPCTNNGNIDIMNIGQAVTEDTIKLSNMTYVSYPDSGSKGSTEEELRHETTNFTYDRSFNDSNFNDSGDVVGNNIRRYVDQTMIGLPNTSHLSYPYSVIKNSTEEDIRHKTTNLTFYKHAAITDKNTENGKHSTVNGLGSSRPDNENILNTRPDTIGQYVGCDANGFIKDMKYDPMKIDLLRNIGHIKSPLYEVQRYPVLIEDGPTTIKNPAWNSLSNLNHSISKAKNPPFSSIWYRQWSLKPWENEYRTPFYNLIPALPRRFSWEIPHSFMQPLQSFEISSAVRKINNEKRTASQKSIKSQLLNWP